MIIWKTIPGYSRYQINNKGILRSLNYKNSRKTKILKPAVDQGYYKTVILGDDNKYKTVRIHKLVMLCFIGECKINYEANHKDGNKLNNKLENLEYCTHSQNVQHSYDNGLQIPLRGEKNSSSKLKDFQVIEIRLYVKKHGYLKDRKQLSIKYNISESALKDIASGRRNSWKHISV
jgi:hypothetical protein